MREPYRSPAPPRKLRKLADLVTGHATGAAIGDRPTGAVTRWARWTYLS